jgi:hypothetical protein
MRLKTLLAVLRHLWLSHLCLPVLVLCVFSAQWHPQGLKSFAVKILTFELRDLTVYDNGGNIDMASHAAVSTDQLMTTFACPMEHTWSVACTLIFHILMMMIHGLFATHLALACFPALFTLLTKWIAFELLGLLAQHPWR